MNVHTKLLLLKLCKHAVIFLTCLWLGSLTYSALAPDPAFDALSDEHIESLMRRQKEQEVIYLRQEVSSLKHERDFWRTLTLQVQEALEEEQSRKGRREIPKIDKERKDGKENLRDRHIRWVACDLRQSRFVH